MAAIDFDALTLDEVELVEDMTGMRLDQMLKLGEVPSTKVLKAFAFVALRRERPDVTVAEVGRMGLGAVTDLIASMFAAPEVPTTPKASSRTGSSARRASSARN